MCQPVQPHSQEKFPCAVLHKQGKAHCLPVVAGTLAWLDLCSGVGPTFSSLRLVLAPWPLVPSAPVIMSCRRRSRVVPRHTRVRWVVQATVTAKACKPPVRPTLPFARVRAPILLLCQSVLHKTPAEYTCKSSAFRMLPYAFRYPCIPAPGPWPGTMYIIYCWYRSFSHRLNTSTELCYCFEPWARFSVAGPNKCVRRSRFGCKYSKRSRSCFCTLVAQPGAHFLQSFGRLDQATFAGIAGLRPHLETLPPCSHPVRPGMHVMEVGRQAAARG